MVSKTFVGRTSELKKLEEYLAGVLKNKKGSVTFITGETGSGRTTLVEEFRRDNALAKEYNMRYAYTRCDELTGTDNPYAAFGFLLGQLLTKNKSDKVFYKYMKDLGPAWLSVIPVVGSLVSAMVSTAMSIKKEIPSENIDQSTMFQRYTKTLQNISEKNPLLLIVDDLQWSDNSSCGLLFHLARNIDEYPIFIIGIYCPSEIETTSHPMKQIRAEMDSKICNELPLGRLSKEELIEYLNAKFPNNKFEAPFIDVLRDKTDGHPLFIVEVIKLLKDQKAIIQENNIWKLSQNINDIDIPTSVAGVINKRIELMENKSRHILRYAAIQGEVFTSVALSKLLDWQELPLLEELNVLVKIHKLIEELESEDLIRKKEGGGHEFIHSFVHKSFYDDLGKREKELLHKKIGEILEELYKDDIYEMVVDLAIHFEKGRVYNKSIDYRLKSAIKANDIHSCSEAIKHCKRALFLLEKTKHVTEEYTKKRMELLFELGRGEEFIGKWGEAIDHYTEAKELAKGTEIYLSEGLLRIGRIWRKRGECRKSIKNLEESFVIKTRIKDGKGLAETLSELGYIYSRQEKITDDTFSKLHKCLTINKKHHDYIGVARTLRAVGLVYRRQHKFTKAHKELTASVKYSVKAKSVLEKAETLREMAIVYGEQGDHEKELSVCDEILQIDEKLGNIIGKIHTLERQSWANRLLGNLSKAVAISEERLKIAKKTCNLHEIAEALQGVALLYRDVGKWEESIDYCKEYIKIAEKLGGADPRHTIHNDLGFIYRRQGKFDDAIQSFEKEIELKTKMDDKTRKMWLTEIGKVYFYQGKLDKALSLYKEALDVASGRQKTSIFWKIGEIYEEKNLLGKALDKYIECSKSIKDQNDILRVSVILTKIGDVYLLQGKNKISQKTFEEARNKHCGEKHGEAITYHSLSKLHFAKGELKKAMEYINKAIEIFDQLRAFRVAGAKLTKARIYLKNKDYQNASEFIRVARVMFTKLEIPHRIAETEMLEGELVYAETGNSKQAHSLILKAAEVFRNLGFKLLENEAARITKTISSKDVH